MIKELSVELPGKEYPIYIGPELLRRPELLTAHIQSKQVLLLTNETIAPLYANTVQQALAGHQLETLVLPDGEKFKSLDSVNQVFDCLLRNKFSRNATLVALGGGVIGDMGGFAAACYQRGINFIQIPTTLLAQVDSSVGGKTAVNHPLGKNMIGAFYQPRCVIADTAVLRTLSDRELSAGIAEVIKYGLIRDYDFFLWLEKHIGSLLVRDHEALTFAIERSCRNKAEVVAQDEFESGVRAVLNLGHTFGHAIETGSGYGEILHGEAVAMGICLAADLSCRLGYLEEGDKTRIVDLLSAANLPIIPPDMGVSRYLELMAVDKKNVDGEIRVILLEAIGKALLPQAVETKKIMETLQYYYESFSATE